MKNTLVIALVVICLTLSFPIIITVGDSWICWTKEVISEFGECKQ